MCIRDRATGRALRTLTLIDSYTRESLAIEVNTGISSRQVTRVLERVIEERGAPGALRSDNGPEFTSGHFEEWCGDRGIALIHIQPGKPVQNGHVESFNGRFRDECLNMNWFINLSDARRKIEAWRKEYNGERPHSSLDYRTPDEFAKACSEPVSYTHLDVYKRQELIHPLLQVVQHGPFIVVVPQPRQAFDLPRFSLPVVIWKFGFHTTVS